MNKQWWKESVVYQIYPKSFQDSNGDGVGDLKGIIQRIPYLEELGVTVIWLCPVYKSPMKDGGYDISDYYDIDPMFGTMEDMKLLIKTANQAGIKIVMDLVVNHTSDQHEWFTEAIHNPESKYRDYYIFKQGNGDGPPNNWRSYFGGSAWEPVRWEKNTYYLHAFAREQPDLNWENPAVRKEIIDMINWWLELGLGGFRIDAILNLKKEIPYGELEIDGEDGLAFIGKWILNQPGIEVWLKEIDEKTFRKHNSLTVAEADVPDEQLSKYIGEDGFFRMVFDFSYTDIDVPTTGEWYKHSGWTVGDFKKAIYNNERITQEVGWGARYLENHDQPRSINKYIPESDINNMSKKMLATLFMMLRGTPFIYQGQEIGMENIRMSSLSEYDDIATYLQYERAKLAGLTDKEAFNAVYKRSRDNSRTPMQWNTDKNAGFSEAESTWLKVNSNYHWLNVEEESEDKESVLNYYKALIQLRTNSAYSRVIIYGNFIPVEFKEENVIAFKRCLEHEEILVLINMGDKEITIQLKEQYSKVVLANSNEMVVGQGIKLEPYAASILA